MSFLFLPLSLTREFVSSVPNRELSALPNRKIIKCFRSILPIFLRLLPPKKTLKKKERKEFKATHCQPTKEPSSVVTSCTTIMDLPDQILKDILSRLPFYTNLVLQVRMYNLVHLSSDPLFASLHLANPMSSCNPLKASVAFLQPFTGLILIAFSKRPLLLIETTGTNQRH